MAIVPVPLSNKSAPSRYRQGGDAHLINCYVEQIGDEGKVPWAIYASDGLDTYSVIAGADGGVRASLYVDDTLYVVVGTRFYSVDLNTQAATLIGTMSISLSTPVYMERNRRDPADIMIVSDGLAYYYRSDAIAPTPAFGQVSTVDGDILPAQSLAFNNGYFVIGTADNRYQAGDLDDVLNWDPLSYGRADANPDNIVRVAQYQSDLVIFGDFSMQFARDVGDQPFPYQTISSNDIGLFAANSVATVEQTLAFVANDRSVRMLNGYEARKISSHAVDRDIEKIVDPNEIIATSWVASGHTFYCVSSSSWTWVYDTVTGLWHERKSNNSNTWNVSVVVRVGDKLIAGDRTKGKLYTMSPDYVDEAGTVLISTIVLPPVHMFPNPLTFNSVFIDAQVGVGVGNGEPQDVDPSIILEWSDDGGDNYKGLRHLTLGAQGKYLTRVRAYRLGQSKEDGYTFRLSWSARVARALYGMAADIEKDAV